jgi:hypothetical protein
MFEKILNKWVLNFTVEIQFNTNYKSELVSYTLS